MAKTWKIDSAHGTKYFLVRRDTTYSYEGDTLTIVRANSPAEAVEQYCALRDPWTSDFKAEVYPWIPQQPIAVFRMLAEEQPAEDENQEEVQP